jgi:hypothetical protein
MKSGMIELGWMRANSVRRRVHTGRTVKEGS